MKILHISDLHLTNGAPFEDRLKKLIEKIRSSVRNNPIDVLALTGDMRNYEATFDAPVEFVEILLRELEIYHVMIVPGNHDMISKDVFETFDQRNICSLLDKKVDMSQIDEQSRIYRKGFVNEIENRAKKIAKEKTCEIKIHSVYKKHKKVEETISGINFVLLNSVYAFNAEKIAGMDIDKVPLCCNCMALEDVFSESGKNTIAVMHVPFTNACEKVRTGYALSEREQKRGRAAIRIEELEEKFKFALAGHTHLRTKISGKYQLTGAIKELQPKEYGFMTDYFNCAIYDVVSKNGEAELVNRTDISYNNQNKDFSEGIKPEQLKEIYEVSGKSLKLQLFGRQLNIGDNWIDKSEASINSDCLCINGEKFFKSDIKTLFDTMVQFVDNNQTEIEYGKNLDMVSRAIDEMDSARKNPPVKNNKLVIPLAIKGALGTGKSTFFNLLYWEMLLRQKRDFEYIPVLIDFTVVNCEELKVILNKVKDISQETKKPIYLLIDGLDNCQIINKDIDLLGSVLTLWANDVDYLMAFNINRHYKSFVTKKYQDRRQTLSIVEDNKNSNALMYFRPVSQAETHFRKSCSSFGVYGSEYMPKNAARGDNDYIDAYFNLSAIEGEERTVKIKKLRDCINDKIYTELEIDFNLLYSVVKNGIANEKAYNRIKSTIIFQTRQNDIQSAAVKYLNTKEPLEMGEFKLLKSQSVINMMFAEYIINTLGEKQSDYKNIINYITFDETDRNSKSPIPQRYFNTKLNFFIKLYLKSRNVAQTDIIENIRAACEYFINDPKEKTKNVNYVALAQLIYIVRHANIGYNEYNLSSFVEMAEEIIREKGQRDPDGNEKDDYSRMLAVTKRTLEVSKITANKNPQDTTKAVYDYVEKMIGSAYLMELNRSFTLFYYGDRDDLHMSDKLNDEKDIERKNQEADETIYNSNIDRYKYYKAFMRLYYRVSTETRDDFDLDLFTLCNIVQIRIQQLFFEKNMETDRLEYTDRKKYIYDTVAMMYKLLNDYFAKEGHPKNKVYYYYRAMQNDFGHILINYYDELYKQKSDDWRLKEIPSIIEKRFVRLPSDREFEKVDKYKRLRKLIWLPSLAKNQFELGNRLDLTNVNRAGWSEGLVLSYNGNPVRPESVAEHSFSLMMLALFLAPPKINNARKIHHSIEQETKFAKLRKKLINMAFLHDIAESLYGDKTPSMKEYWLTQALVNNTTVALCYLGTYDTFADFSEYANTVTDCVYENDSELYIIFNLIDKLQFGNKIVQYNHNEQYQLSETREGRIESIYQDLKRYDNKSTEKILGDNHIGNLFKWYKDILCKLEEINKK